MPPARAPQAAASKVSAAQVLGRNLMGMEVRGIEWKARHRPGGASGLVLAGLVLAAKPGSRRKGRVYRIESGGDAGPFMPHQGSTGGGVARGFLLSGRQALTCEGRPRIPVNHCGFSARLGGRGSADGTRCSRSANMSANDCSFAGRQALTIGCGSAKGAPNTAVLQRERALTGGVAGLGRPC